MIDPQKQDNNETKFKIGMMLLLTATVMLLSGMILPRVLSSDSIIWTWIVIASVIIYFVSALFLYLGRKTK